MHAGWGLQLRVLSEVDTGRVMPFLHLTVARVQPVGLGRGGVGEVKVWDVGDEIVVVCRAGLRLHYPEDAGISVVILVPENGPHT